MIINERELANAAAALADKRVPLTAPERHLISRRVTISATTLRKLRTEIRAGGDPLGDAFCRVRSAEERRGQGATYTPTAIVRAMLSWAAGEATRPKRVIDVGAGSGRFIIEAARTFLKADLVAVESDPLAALLLRANANVLGFTKRLSLEVRDYRDFTLPRINGSTLFIGNPPYVRHHAIPTEWKAWFSSAGRSLGFAASELAGLHVHFFLRTRQLAQTGDFGVFITAAEWLDVNYGSVVRKMLADGLGGTAVHVIDPRAEPFPGTLATGAITCFRVGNRPERLTIRSVRSLEKLNSLSAGKSVNWSEAEKSSRWSTLIRQAPRPRSGEIELGELFRVHRGQVTGCNRVWIAGDMATELPRRFLRPTITKARELIAAGDVLSSATNLKRVVDLPVNLGELRDDEREAVARFLAWAKKMEADESYVAKHRRSWWAVQLRAPAPILCTYMARRAPAFVRNFAGARHVNIAHGLYPIEPLSDELLMAITRHLNATASVSSGRVYAGGLIKFEPGEVSRLHVPDLSMLSAAP